MITMKTSLLIGLLACGDKESETWDTSIEVEETDTDSDSIVGTPIALNLTGATGMKIGLVKVEFPQDDGTEDTGEESDDSVQKNVGTLKYRVLILRFYFQFESWQRLI